MKLSKQEIDKVVHDLSHCDYAICITAKQTSDVNLKANVILNVNYDDNFLSLMCAVLEKDAAFFDLVMCALQKVVND